MDRGKAGAELDALALTIDDQAAFATLSRRLLEDLDLAADEPSEQEPEEGGDDDEGDEEGPDEGDEADDRKATGGEMEMRSEEAERTRARTRAPTAKPTSTRARRRAARRAPTRRGPALRRNWPDEPITDYKPFTTRFDEMVAAGELCDEEELTGCAPTSTSRWPASAAWSRVSPTGCSGG